MDYLHQTPEFKVKHKLIYDKGINEYNEYTCLKDNVFRMLPCPFEIQGDSESKKIFRLQKKTVRMIGRVGQYISCRNLFKDLNILTLPCLYISEVVCKTRSNWEQMKQNEEIHDHSTRQKSDFHTQYCRITLFKTVMKMWV